MRGPALLLTTFMLCLIAPAGAAAQSTAGGADASAPAQPADHGPHGGAEFGVDPDAAPRVYVPGTRAVRMKNGYAAAPADAPPAVQAAVFAANEIVGKPYRYGGGHRRWKDSGYDCSGTISYALRPTKTLRSPLDSSSFMRWGKAGKGDWITVYTNPGHAYAVIAGLRLDTSSAGERRSSGRGPRWRTTARRMRGFKVRHPAGL